MFGRLKYVHIAEPLVPECNAFWDSIITEIQKYIHHHVLIKFLPNWLGRRKGKCVLRYINSPFYME